MNRPATVVIIGGGVVGMSIAAHLAALGCSDVTVIDPAPGGGSTSRATGGFRAQFGSEVNVRLSLLSREKLLRFADEHQVDPGFDQIGYLFLATKEDELESLKSAVHVQRAAGLAESRLINRSEALQLNPRISDADVIGGTYCPTDGFIRPMQILAGYTRSASRAGVRFIRSKVIAINTGDSRVTSLVTDSGETIGCDALVNAAGPFAASVAALAGVDLPVSPLRRDVAATRELDVAPETAPMTIWLHDGFHYRYRDGRLLFLRPDHPAQQTLDGPVSDTFLDAIERCRGERLPSLAGAPIDQSASWSGLYEMSPDRHAILGSSELLTNFFFANGSSGHGVMHAPAIGQLVAEMIVHGSAQSLDVSSLRPDRFRDNEPVEGLELL